MSQSSLEAACFLGSSRHHRKAPAILLLSKNRLASVPWTRDLLFDGRTGLLWGVQHPGWVDGCFEVMHPAPLTDLICSCAVMQMHRSQVKLCTASTISSGG